MKVDEKMVLAAAHPSLRGRGATEVCGFLRERVAASYVDDIQSPDLSYGDELINGLINATSR